MQKSLPILICCWIALACQQNEGPPVKRTRIIKTTIPGDARNARVDSVIQPLPVFIDRSLFGTKLGPDGNVAEEAFRAESGEKVYLTMFLHDSPVGLHTQAVWTDRAAKKVVFREERDMKGAKVVTFALDTHKLKPGRYQVEGLWGGNVAADKEFDIIGKAKK